MKQVNKMKRMITKLVMLFAVAGASLSARAQTPVTRTITATGTAKMEVIPDMIYVQVNLREYDKKGGGKVDIETIKNNFLKVCKSMGLNDTDVTVQSYSGYDGTIYTYKKKKKENPDLKAGINYWVKLNKLAQMDELVSKLDDEATQNFSIAKTDYSKREEMELKMKQDAIRAAREKAIALAFAINEKVGNAVTINEPNETGDVPRPYYMNTLREVSMSADKEEPALDVDFKKMKIEYEASVTFALL